MSGSTKNFIIVRRCQPRICWHAGTGFSQPKVKKRSVSMPVPVNWIEGLGATSASSPADVDEDVDVEDEAVLEELLLVLALALVEELP